MRITFFIVVLANLVLLLWQTQIRARHDAEANLPDIPADQRLVLVSEQRKSDKAALPDEPQVAATQPPASSVVLPDIEMVDADGVPVATAEPAAQTEPAAPAQVCYTLGPFKEPGDAKTASVRLRNLGAEVAQRSKVEQEQYGYRVYLKPYATREEAVAEARKLADLGIRDYYIIADDPEYQNGISLGLFRKKSGAIRRMAQVRRFDFKPYMEIRYRDTTIYWLDYEHAKNLDSQTLWRELAEQDPGLQRLDRDCKG